MDAGRWRLPWFVMAWLMGAGGCGSPRGETLSARDFPPPAARPPGGASHVAVRPATAIQAMPATTPDAALPPASTVAGDNMRPPAPVGKRAQQQAEKPHRESQATSSAAAVVLAKDEPPDAAAVVEDLKPAGVPKSPAAPSKVEPIAWTAGTAATAPRPPTAREVLDKALAFYRQNDRYTCRVTRRERVGMQLLPEEVMRLDFRLVPRSIRYQWLDAKNDGRECVWVEGRHDGKITTRGGKGDFLMTGKVVAVDPNGFLARGKARYPIFESGLDNVVAKFDRVTRQFEKGNAALGVVAVRGLVKHADLPDPALEIHLKIPPGGDPALPKGADRRGYFDPATGEIRLVVTTSFAGELLEYYRFDRFIANPGLTDADFDPSRLWPTGSKATSVGRTTASDAATPAAKLTPADGSTEF